MRVPFLRNFGGSITTIMNKDTQDKLNSFLNDFEKSSQSLIRDIEEHIERMSDAKEVKEVSYEAPDSTTPMGTPVRFTDDHIDQKWATGKFVGMSNRGEFPYHVAWMVDGFLHGERFEYCEILEDQS